MLNIVCLLKRLHSTLLCTIIMILYILFTILFINGGLFLSLQCMDLSYKSFYRRAFTLEKFPGTRCSQNNVRHNTTYKPDSFSIFGCMITPIQAFNSAISVLEIWQCLVV